MKSKLRLLKKIFLTFLMIDGFIVMSSIVAIASNVDIQHIPFWDAQMQFLVGLLG